MGNGNENKPEKSEHGDDTMDTTDKVNPPSELSATVAKINLQPFWPEKSNTWFQMAEIQFDLQGVKADKQKYLHTLSSLSPNTCELISDFLQKPPTDNRYQALKKLLLDRLTPSAERQLESLLSGQDLGDRKPSEALRHIRTLAGTGFSENLIRSLWIRKMPEIIKIALVAQPESITTDALAKTADRMHDVINIGKHPRQIHSIQNFPRQTVNHSNNQSRSTVQTDRSRDRNRRPSPSSGTVEDRLARLEAKLNALFRDGQNGSRRRRSSSRPQTRSPSNSNSRQGKCWYHTKFGTAARKCITPCTFRNSQPSTSKFINKMDIEGESKNE